MSSKPKKEKPPDRAAFHKLLKRALIFLISNSLTEVIHWVFELIKEAFVGSL